MENDQECENTLIKTPLLYVDVNLGPDQTERIIIYEGDRSEELVNKFANSHQLDDQTKNKFRQLLDN